MATSSTEPEWRKNPLSERLAYAYIHELFVDAELSFSLAGRRYIFKVHKNILSHYSEVLENYFYGHGKRIDPFAKIDPEGLRLVLGLLYKVPLGSSPKDKSVILSAYHAAKTLRFRNLESKIKQEIFSHTVEDSCLTGDSFWKFLELSRLLELDDVTSEFLKYAEANTQIIVDSKSFPNVTFSTLRCVLSLDRLALPEIDILASVVRWYKANITEPFAKDCLRGLLACIRFRNMSAREFQAFMKANWGIMKGRDYLKILTHLELPVSCPLPSWCQQKIRQGGAPLTFPRKKNEMSSTYYDGCFLTEKAETNTTSFLDMYFRENFSDVCFLVGQAEVPIKAHRNILALGSPVFEKMFYGPLPDTRQEIKINTKHPEGFETMIRFFYDDAKPNFLKDASIASMTFDIALKYGSQRLKNTCLLSLPPETLKSSTFWSHLENRIQLGIEAAAKYIVQHFPWFAASHTKELLEHSSFLNASEESITFVLKLDSLDVKEIEILESVAKWLEVDPVRLKESKFDLLQHVRFCDISLVEFLSFLKRHDGILSKEASLQIIHHLNDGTSKLPEWCYNGPPRVHGKTPEPGRFGVLKENERLKLPIKRHIHPIYLQ